MLAGPTGDGQNKRARGEKVSWKRDPGHLAAFHRHFAAGLNGVTVDPDSGCHPWQHAMWRLGALVAQHQHKGEDGWL